MIWALLFFNVLSYAKMATVIPIPHKIGQVLTQGALVAAFVLALTINPKVKVRPNLLLGLYSLLAIVSLAMSIRFIGVGTTYRASSHRVPRRAVAPHPVVGTSRLRGAAQPDAVPRPDPDHDGGGAPHRSAQSLRAELRQQPAE